jgi:hypothetical protein
MDDPERRHSVRIASMSAPRARDQTQPETQEPANDPPDASPTPPSPTSKRAALWARINFLMRAIQENDQAEIEQGILRLSRSRRVFAPLALIVGAFLLLFDGLRLLVSNWRLTLVQILPAMWIWLAMFDLKAHALHGKTFHALRGAALIPLFSVIVSITMACFFLNALFALAISQPRRPPKIGPAAVEARRHLKTILASGFLVGMLLAFATTVVTRWGRPWFALALGIVVGLMMVSYVAVPSRLVGVKSTQSSRDKLWASAVGGVIGTTVCTPPYLLGRAGLLMLGSKVLFIPGIFLLAIGVTLQAGATGAVRAIKMSIKLTPGDAAQPPSPEDAALSSPSPGDSHGATGPGDAAPAPSAADAARAPGQSS